MIIPQLWIVAGANGSGKTTLVEKYLPYFKEQIPIINPDKLALELDPSNPIYTKPHI